MSAPTLRSVSGRTQPSITPKAATSVSSPIQQRAFDSLAEKTESVRSDAPLPSTSDVFVPAIPKFNLTQTFPSILSTLDLMRSHKNVKDTGGICSLTQIFSACLRTIIHSMDDLPYGVRLNPTYEVAQYGVVFTGKLLEAQMSRLGIAGEGASMVLELADLAIRNLRAFLKVAEGLVTDQKPLPELPMELPPTKARPDEEPIPRVPLINIIDEVLNNPISDGLPPASKQGVLDISPEKKKKMWRRNIIRLIVKRGAKSSKTSLLSITTKSSVTLVNNEMPSPSIRAPKESFEAGVKSRPPDQAYLPRQSALYYLADPYCPEIDVDMPLPTGDTVAVRLDHQGVMKAASLPALVRILTSKESVLDQDFTPTFFICFRFFTTPAKFFEELVKRFDEQPPANLNPAQLRIWTRDAMGVHIRVGKAILMWLDLYWKSEVDSEVLEALEAFTLDRLVQELPEGMVTHILEGLHMVGGEEPICRRIRKTKDLEFIYERATLETKNPTNFHISIATTTCTTVQLMGFNTPAGREEFARQLTAKLSERFQLVDPEDAILFWHCDGDSAVGKILQGIVLIERSLSLWVTQTVLDQPTLLDRCQLLEFWLDISTRCVRLRNFSSANCIFAGVSHSSIARMKETILHVGVSSKHQYRTLNGCLGGQDNYASYRQVLLSVEPTIPLIAPLIRDVISALAVIPTKVGTTDNSKEKNLINLCSYRIVMKTVRAMESCLVPYRIVKNEQFRAWLDGRLVDFPSTLESDITNGFYTQSTAREARDPLLKTLVDPWSHTITGILKEDYTLHSLPVHVPATSPAKSTPGNKCKMLSSLRRA